MLGMKCTLGILKYIYINQPLWPLGCKIWKPELAISLYSWMGQTFLSLNSPLFTLTYPPSIEQPLFLITYYAKRTQIKASTWAKTTLWCLHMWLWSHIIINNCCSSEGIYQASKASCFEHHSLCWPSPIFLSLSSSKALTHWHWKYAVQRCQLCHWRPDGHGPTNRWVQFWRILLSCSHVSWLG